MLDLIEIVLKQADIKFLRLDGTLRQDQRAGVLSAFSKSNGPPVLLASLRSAGVGLNLTAASRVFLMDRKSLFFFCFFFFLAFFFFFFFYFFFCFFFIN